jgi:hypothetical protein
MGTGFIGRRFAATVALTGALALAGGAAVAMPASASTGAYGVVAVHTGGWGYMETVYGKGTTHQLATSPVWEVGGILGGAVVGWSSAAAQLAALPLSVYAWTIHYRAQQADASGQCFAMVRPFWGAPSFPGVESWGCR